ncbi:MAG: DUF4366 domain-containing protein [Lachnospiraceae bacterium]|nr:DUF4366 domain-containing protein [Lachnospiraceae bacterium]
MENKIGMNIRTKIAGVIATASVLLIGAAPMTVFAQVPECTCEVKCTEDCVDSDCEICKEDISMCEGVEIEPVKEPETEETFGPLTPDGNLTLVDDYGTIEAGGKQFVTVVTKSGNYFYIIIDRDDEGDETVHFLNMVDESDLLSLMDDEEAQAYIDSIATTEEPIVEATEESAEEAAEVVEVETEEKGGSNMTGILVLVLVATVGGIGGYIYLKGSKKKDKKQVGPDPDADYKDDEEDYLAGLSEDDDFEDEEIGEDLDEKASEYEEQE